VTDKIPWHVRLTVTLALAAFSLLAAIWIVWRLG
jgi:hypothetical protein